MKTSTQIQEFAIRRGTQFVVPHEGGVKLVDHWCWPWSFDQARETAYRIGACEIISQDARVYRIGADTPVVPANKKRCFYHGAADNNLLQTLSKAALADICTELIRQLHGQCDHPASLIEVAGCCNLILAERGDKLIETASDFVD